MDLELEICILAVDVTCFKGMDTNHHHLDVPSIFFILSHYILGNNAPSTGLDSGDSMVSKIDTTLPLLESIVYAYQL